MAIAKGFISATAIVDEEEHSSLRALLAGKKLLPHKTFSDWLRAKEREEVGKIASTGKRK